MELDKSTANGGNFTVNGGNSGMELGKSTTKESHFTLDGGNPVPYHNKETP
ncbi:MAG: hypothetical protein LBD44_05040 [Spirochaetaceae bacterium]|jgi:hypothetical protein|nr:hypothetical protein [Spirochaetaceae bacterium]